MFEVKCSFCNIITVCRQHHLIPRVKGGIKTVLTCMTCESFIHQSWSHSELRDIYNSTDAILATVQFQKFLKWRRKQSADTIFKSDRGNNRDKNKYH